MGVRDVTTLAQKSVIVVNTDVAASQTVADRFCEMYGIPKSNQFTYAMGTNVLWEYTSSRYATFWADLETKVNSIGAYAVFSTAGCPVGIEVPDQDGVEGVNGDGLNFALLIGFVKRIRSNGYEPRVTVSGGFYAMKGPDFTTTLFDQALGTNHKGAQITDATALGQILTVAADSDYTAAGSPTTTEYQFTTIADRAPNYSIADNLLTGHIGYYTKDEATHPADLWDKSRVILGKAGNLQVPASAQSARVALVCPQTLSGSNLCHDSRQALIGKKLQNLGLDVKWWYPDAASAVADALLPESEGYAWTSGDLDTNSGTATTDCTFTLAIGCGFANGKEATWNATMIPSTSGGVMCVGASDGDDWGAKGMASGHSYVQHTRTYNWHQGATQQGKMADIWLNLLRGKTLAEAAWCSLEMTFLAVGDPLCRPFPT